MILVRVVGVCDNCAREAEVASGYPPVAVGRGALAPVPANWIRGPMAATGQHHADGEPMKLPLLYCSLRCAREAASDNVR